MCWHRRQCTTVLLFVGDPSCSTLRQCTNCICGSLGEGCEITPAIFRQCKKKVKNGVNVRPRNLEGCSENPQCITNCIQNYLLANANQGCTNGTDPADISCNSFARLFKGKGEAKKCKAPAATFFASRVDTCCGKGKTPVDFISTKINLCLAISSGFLPP